MKKQKQHNLWDKPWGYVESFIIGMGLMLAGFAIEASTGNAITLSISFPHNLIILIAYCTLLFVAHKWFSHVQIIRWLTKVPAAISSISLVTFMVMIMGIIPQTHSDNYLVNLLGLNHITTNWAFILILFVFLSNLGLVTIKRFLQFKTSNIGFILNHLGLFIALTAGLLGSGDLERLTIQTTEEQPSWIAYNEDNQPVELPFAFVLNDFRLDEYAPKLALVDNETGELHFNEGKNLYLIEKGNDYVFGDYDIKVDDFLVTSGRIGDRYAFTNELGAPPSALVEVYDKQKDSTINGWISCGSFIKQPQSLKINEQISLVMTIPEAKKFSSDITILTKDEQQIKATLEVNKPYKHDHWKIYQYSYDDTLGKWSNTSVLELVKDPWLPYIYIGIFMMIAGAIYMFWIGNTKINKQPNGLD
ncbi:cytochrome c biogenesis protein ResB [Winogradskyella sp.]|jgi:hypothetical protein|uniref:cytochrome c biogenesis protein ResB n=1 Tax=Winogradskyella sp. TaxID=1883156 RepID=UPI0025E774BB|nr:cytochrome c biogenesis protein ResB [Winogradskyella sp.]MCT4628699.1 cytochrome c biogenesis protein ResB [Winogradskyella sp.]